jgi:hypothetical protein
MDEECLVSLDLSHPPDAVVIAWMNSVRYEGGDRYMWDHGFKCFSGVVCGTKSQHIWICADHARNEFVLAAAKSNVNRNLTNWIKSAL